MCCSVCALRLIRSDAGTMGKARTGRPVRTMAKFFSKTAIRGSGAPLCLTILKLNLQNGQQAFG